MTQPRSYQINAPFTKFTSVPQTSVPTAGDLTTSYTSTTYLQKTVSGVSGGVQSSLPATLVGSVNGYITTLSASQTFSVLVTKADGTGQTFTVTIDAADIKAFGGSYPSYTTVSRIAARMNTAAAAATPAITDTIASVSDENRIIIRSIATGSDATVAITDGTAAITTALFGSGTSQTATGLDIASGVVNESYDLKGGYAYPQLADGSPVLSNSNIYQPFNDTSLTQPYPQGQQVFGRVLDDGSNVTVSYKTMCLGSGPILGKESNLGALTVGDNITFTFLDLITGESSTFTRNYTASPADLATVVTQLNLSWANTIFGSKANVYSSKSGPYYLSSSSSFDISLDGAAAVSVTLDQDTRSATQVVAAINTAFSPTTIAYVSDDSFYIRSSTSDGTGSTIAISGMSEEVSRVLGIVPGTYRGFNPFSAVGTEILITPPSPTCQVSISSSAGSLSKFGFSASNPVRAYELDVGFPTVPANVTSPTVTYPNGYYSVSTSECLAFGEISTDHDSNEALESAKTSLPQFSPGTDSIALKANQAVKYDLYGNLTDIKLDSLPSGSRVGRVDFPPAGDGANYNPFMSVDSIVAKVAPVVEARQADDLSVRVSVDGTDDDPKISTTVNAYFDNDASKYKPDDSSLGSTIIESSKDSIKLGIQDSGDSEWTTWDNSIEYKKSGDITGHYQLGMSGSSVLRNTDSVLKITDDNIDSASSQAFINVSDASGGEFLRIGGKEANSTVSLIKSINGRAYISIGDGSNTFGDFNGSGAFNAAVNFINTNNINNATIFVKAGTYESASQVTITDKNITVIGESRDNCTIRRTNAGSFITLTSSAADIYTLVAKSVSIEAASANSSAIVSNSVKVDIENCSIEGLSLSLASPTGDLLGFCAHNCTIYSSGAAYAALSIKPGATQLFDGYQNYPGLFVQNTKFVCSSAVNNRCILIEGPVPGTSSATAYQYENFTFDNCEFSLASSQLNLVSGDVVPVRGTGLFELDPQDASSLVVKQLTFSGCHVSALGTTPSFYNVLMAASPFLTSDSPVPAYVGIIKSLVITDTRFDCYIGTNSDSLAPSCFIIGAGVESLSLTDCQINLTSTTNGLYGRPPYWYSSSITDDYDRFPNIIFDCLNSSIRNLEINGCIRRSRKAGTEWGADLGLVQGNRLSVDGLSLSYSSTNTGAGDAPKCRVFYKTPVTSSEPSYSTSTQGYIKGLRLTGFSVADLQSWLGADDRGFIEVRTKNTIFDSCLVTGFAYSTTPTHKNWSSILCTGLASGGISDNVSIQNSRFESGSRGINMSFDPSELVGDFTISGNFIKVAGNSSLSEYGQGIAYWTNDAAPLDCSRIIRGNQIEVSGMPWNTASGPLPIGITNGLATSAGIWIGANENQPDDPILMSIVGNSITCINTNPVNANHIPAIFVSTNLNATASTNPGAIIDSNICKEYNYFGSGSYAVGWIHAMAQDGIEFIPVPTLGPNTPYNYRLFGIETALTGTDGSYMASAATIRNYAKLCLGNVPGKES